MLPFFLLLADIEPLQGAWAEFSRAGSLNHVKERVEVATAPRSAGQEFRYTLRFTRQTIDSDPTVLWADSATCPAARSVLSSMRDLEMPTPTPYGTGEGLRTITMDGTLFSLTAPSSDNMGTLTLRSNVGSPLAAWIASAFERLEPCWTETAPRLAVG